MKSRRYNQDGFTLIEIMVVILILGLLATIVVQSLRGAADKAKHTKAEADLAEIKTALDRYYLDNRYNPTTDQGLQPTAACPPTTKAAAISSACPRIHGALPTSTRATGTRTC
jgi:general secretion pathway protein G